MDEKTTGIVSYLTWVGLLVAVMFTKKRTSYIDFHIRQSLGIMLAFFMAGLLGYILPAFLGDLGGLLGWVLTVFVIILWVLGIIGALKYEKKPVPVLGEKFQEWFKSI